MPERFSSIKNDQFPIINYGIKTELCFDPEDFINSHSNTLINYFGWEPLLQYYIDKMAGSEGGEDSSKEFRLGFNKGFRLVLAILSYATIQLEGEIYGLGVDSDDLERIIDYDAFNEIVAELENETKWEDPFQNPEEGVTISAVIIDEEFDSHLATQQDFYYEKLLEYYLNNSLTKITNNERYINGFYMGAKSVFQAVSLLSLESPTSL